MDGKPFVVCACMSGSLQGDASQSPYSFLQAHSLHNYVDCINEEL